MRMKSCQMTTSDGCRSSLILADVRELTTLRRYDTHGKAGLEGGGGMPGGMDSNDLFSQLFGGGGGSFFGGGGGGRPQGPRRGKDLVHRISVSLEDLYKGKVQKLALSKSVLCKGCDGLGGKKGAVKECSACHGQGVRVTLRQLGPMVQQIQQPCGDCDGTGEIVDPKNRCKQCNGKKTQQERKVLEVHIDKGMKSGQQIKFPGESDQSPGIEPGDVIFVVEEKEHPRFQRKGDDLFCEAEIDLLTALAGGEFAIEHLDDRTLKVQITAGEIIKPGKWRIPKLLPTFAYPFLSGVLKVIQGQGMPSHRHHNNGNLYVKLSVKFPDSLSAEQMAALEQALPPRKPLAKIPAKHEVEEVFLQEPTERQRSGAEAMDEDEDDEMRGGPGVQCAQRKSL